MPRLRRSDPSRPGIARHRCGRGFTYSWMISGERVEDPDTLQRISGLVIPPAWTDVWICQWPHGHIQAVGTDTAGRRQYLYHDAWRKRRDAEKFQRSLEFGMTMPALRTAIQSDLERRDLGRQQVLAAAVRLLDIGGFRIGSETYAREHETFGIATLLKEHATFQGDQILFSYPAKGSVPRTVRVHDRVVRDVLAALRRRRGGSSQLLAWRGPSGWTDLHSADINAYIKETAGPRFSAKDFRTWAGTVYAAAVLSKAPGPLRSARARRRAVTTSIRHFAEHLGNTPAVCRASYVDPRVIDHFENGHTIDVPGWEGPDAGDESWLEVRESAEQSVIALLSDVDVAAA